jgi:hypothetical protein
MGIEVFHCFFESHHASGCQDNAGKGPRIAMMRLIGFKNQSLYDYDACMVCDRFVLSTT